MTYRPDIDGLRAVAVLSVVLSHAGFGMPGGFVGVDVFFVISGYLITGRIVRDLERGTFSFGDFWERRARRIVPALGVMTCTVLAAGWWLLVPTAYTELGKSVVALVLLLANVYFWQDTQYFAAASATKPLLHTWSLAVEEQFYLLLPPLLWCMARLRLMHRLFSLLAVLTAVSFIISCWGAFHHSSATFYLLPTRAWELLAGSLLALAPQPTLVGSGRIGNGASAVGLSAVLLPCALYDSQTPFPGLAALLPVLGTVLVIVAGGNGSSLPFTNRMLAARPFVFVGLISYSLYLWHWPLLSLASEWMLETPPAAVRAALVVAAFMISVLSWKYVETPVRSRRVFVSRRRLAFAVGVASLVVSGAGVAVWLNGGWADRLPPQAEVFARTGTRDVRSIHDLTATDVPERLVRLGASEDDVQLLVWGDSHAMAALPAIDAVCRDRGIAARAATRGAAAPILNFTRDPRDLILREQSTEFSRAVFDYVAAEKVQHVVLIGVWLTYLTEPAASRPAWDERKPDPAAIRRLVDTVEQLQQAGAKVYFMLDVPIFEYNIPERLVQLAWRGRDVSTIAMSRERCERQVNIYRQAVAELRSRGVVILDPLPSLLERAKTADFRPYDERGSYYVDAHHLSALGAEVVRPTFLPLVDAIRPAVDAAPGIDSDPRR